MWKFFFEAYPSGKALSCKAWGFFCIPFWSWSRCYTLPHEELATDTETRMGDRNPTNMSFQSNIPTHKDGDKCPACSGERDKGGRLELKVSKFKTKNGHMQFWLKCSNCKYTLGSKFTYENSFQPEAKRELLQTL
jgi:hypothetical protein